MLAVGILPFDTVNLGHARRAYKAAFSTLYSDSVGGANQRALLAVLLLHANEPVSAEDLTIALWGEDAPARAVKTIQVYVSRLQRALGDTDVLATTPALT
jgi:DNA-binding SARP family transcriptional activator